MKLLDSLNGKGNMGAPRTIGELEQVLQITMNTPKRYVLLETANGRKTFEEVQILERLLTQVVQTTRPNPVILAQRLEQDPARSTKPDDIVRHRHEKSEALRTSLPLDTDTIDRATGLLDRLNLLARMSTEFMLRKIRLRTRKSIDELVPTLIQEQDTQSQSDESESENVQETSVDMQLSST